MSAFAWVPGPWEIDGVVSIPGYEAHFEVIDRSTSTASQAKKEPEKLDHNSAGTRGGGRTTLELEVQDLPGKVGESAGGTRGLRLAIDDEDGLSTAFEKNPSAALSRLVYELLRLGTDQTGQVFSIRRVLAIRFIFERMLDSTPFIQRLGAQAILTFADPAEVFAVALCGFRLHGYEGRLSLAASLLSRFGERSWPLLASLAKSGLPEREYFVSTIARLEMISSRERLNALIDLARNPDPSIRERVMDVLEGYSEHETAEVLNAIASAGRYDQIERSAIEQLQHQA